MTESVELGLLADQPEALDQVTAWYHTEWGWLFPGSTEADCREVVATYVKRRGPPLIVVARSNGVLVGAAQLKLHEMDQFPQFEHWIGGVYVAEDARRAGVAKRLVEAVKARARSAGVETLYLQTERMNGGLYRAVGFEPVTEAHLENRSVLVMAADLR